MERLDRGFPALKSRKKDVNLPAYTLAPTAYHVRIAAINNNNPYHTTQLNVHTATFTHQAIELSPIPLQAQIKPKIA